MPINWTAVGLENALGVLLEVVELASMQRPGEHAQDAQHENGGERNEKVQDVHCNWLTTIG
jgi:hypothetical protein